MKIIISPAKTMVTANVQSPWFTYPRFEREHAILIQTLKELGVNQLCELMSISEDLGWLNYNRFAQWNYSCDLTNSRQALYFYNGDVYEGLDAKSFEISDLEYAQANLRILSGLYGLLRPMDLIQAYRLEMGTKLKVAGYKDLYAFWGDKIDNLLYKDMLERSETFLLNLASQEYFKAVQKLSGKIKILHADFRELKNGEYKFISFTAKRARGLMARYIIKNKLENPDDLKGFNYEKWGYSEALSTHEKLVFIR